MVNHNITNKQSILFNLYRFPMHNVKKPCNFTELKMLLIVKKRNVTEKFILRVICGAPIFLQIFYSFFCNFGLKKSPCKLQGKNLHISKKNVETM